MAPHSKELTTEQKEIIVNLSFSRYEKESRGVVFRLPPLRGKFSMFPLSLIRFKNFWIVLLLMPVIFCNEKPSFDMEKKNCWKTLDGMYSRLPGMSSQNGDVVIVLSTNMR
jgi:hypothetical protein